MNKVDAKILASRKKYLKWSFTQPFKREKQFHYGTIAIERD